VLMTKYYSDDVIKKDEMVETRGIYWERKSARVVYVGKPG